MAKITSKSQLNVGTELVIDETAKTIRLVAAGNLVAKDGVTLQAVYSKLVDLWATATYQDSPFPLYAIDALSGQFQIGTDGATFSGWNWFDDTTRNMLRDGGWAEYSAAGVKTAEYCGFVGLGSIGPATTVQPYYHLAAADAAANFPFADQFNCGIKVYDNVSLDKRTYAKAFVREYGKKFKSSVLADTGSTGTGPFKQNFLVSNEDDLKLTTLLGSNQATADAAMSGAPYNGITVAYYSTNQTRSIGGTNRNFKIIIEGNGGTLEQIYAKVQYLLRQNSNINTGGDAGTITGKTAADLLSFVGDTLVTGTGVYIDDVLAVNRLVFIDDSGIERTFPFTSAGTLAFDSSFVGGVYRAYFASGAQAGNNFGEASALTVNDASGDPIAGAITSENIPFDYAYDSNVQRGAGTAGTPVALKVFALKKGSTKPRFVTYTLTRAVGQTISFAAEADRGYVNP